MDDVRPGREIEADILDGAEMSVAVVVVVGNVEVSIIEDVDVVGGADEGVID